MIRLRSIVRAGLDFQYGLPSRLPRASSTDLRRLRTGRQSTGDPGKLLDWEHGCIGSLESLVMRRLRLLHKASWTSLANVEQGTRNIQLACPRGYPDLSFSALRAARSARICSCFSMSHDFDWCFRLFSSLLRFFLIFLAWGSDRLGILSWGSNSHPTPELPGKGTWGSNVWGLGCDVLPDEGIGTFVITFSAAKISWCLLSTTLSV